MKKPNVLFMCIDCLRSDFAFGDHGNPKPLFSHFNSNGTLYDTVVATASTTTPAVASFMTGTYPYEHGIFSLQKFCLSDDVLTLAKVFEQNGYQTLAHVTGPLLEETNLDRGFEIYKYRDREKTVYTQWWEQFKLDIQTLNTPWFVYLHLWEPHEPRYPPPYVSDDELVYESCVRGVFRKINQLLDILNRDSTIIALTGDHGESISDGTLRNKAALLTQRYWIPYISLNTHIGTLNVPVPYKILDIDYIDDAISKYSIDVNFGYPSEYLYDNYLRPRGIALEDFFNKARQLRKSEIPSDLHRTGHGFQIYDYLTRVPFGIMGPGISQNGRISHQVSQIDIFPTLVSAAGIEYPEVEGKSMLNGKIESKPAFSRACGAFLRSEENWLYGVRYKEWKLIKGTKRPLKQLFHIKSDPKELDNVVDQYPKVANELDCLLDKFISLETQYDEFDISEEDKLEMDSHLQDLGYIQ